MFSVYALFGSTSVMIVPRDTTAVDVWSIMEKAPINETPTLSTTAITYTQIMCLCLSAAGAMKAPLALVLLAMTASLQLAHAQQQDSKTGSSSSSSSSGSKRTPYSCFYNECAPSKPVQNKGQFQSCLEIGVYMHLPCAATVVSSQHY
jgi:hypothetical protein